MRRYYYNYLSKLKFELRRKKQYKRIGEKLKICILFYIPKKQGIKSKTWRDGFTQGIDILKEDFHITWINIDEYKPTSAELNDFDFIIAKTGWHAPVDTFLRSVKNLKTPRGIVVSCSNPIKEDFVLFFYDIVWFQTFYYEQFVDRHPRKYHSYGGNLNDFTSYKWDKTAPKTYDAISIGIIESYKRYEKLCDFPGEKKLIIGDTGTAYFEKIKDNLRKSCVDVIDYIPQNELTKYLDMSKCLYIPSHVNGGGERVIMEFKKSGIPIVTETDNPKLTELVNGPDWDERSYGEGIRRGLNDFFKLSQKNDSNPILPRKNLMVGRYSYTKNQLTVSGEGYVEIGSFCELGENVKLLTDNSDNGSNISDKKNCILIGNNVTIGDNVIINSGTTIGDGARIENNAVISGNISPYTKSDGLFSDSSQKIYPQEKIDELLKIQWWNWSDTKIKNNKDFFLTNLINDTFPDHL